MEKNQERPRFGASKQYMKWSFIRPPPSGIPGGGRSLRGQMMKMLRFLGLAVFVVCIAAFASGCGGGGGGGGAAVMECPQGQVGTYPDCMDPGPTDEDRIAEARREVASILANAQARAGAASSAAGALGANEDATADQIANALARAGDAQAALAAVVAASRAANAATTPAAAEMAVADANTALNDLRTAQSAIASIQSAVNAVAEARRQQAANEMALTGGSSLIRHLRDNRKVSDAVLENLDADSITVGAVTDTAVNGATFPYHTGERNPAGAGVYPQPQGTERGVLGVTITVGGTNGGGAVSSATAQTAKITGTGRLSQGLDVKNSAGTLFVNAYTDIAVERRVSTDVVDDTNTPNINEAYHYVPDPDYLLAGIWLNDVTGSHELGAFAYGSENITNVERHSSLNRCTAAQGTAPNACTEATGFHQITNFVSEGRDLEATYRGGANGAYLAGGMASYFTADVKLDAVFRHVTGGSVTGSNISGEVTNIAAGGKSIEGSIDLISHTFGNDISGQFTDGTNDPAAVGVIAGESYSGRWTGQFFGKRTKSSPLSPANNNNGRNYTYQPDAPGSVAGTFYVIKQSAPVGDAAFIGSFGAHR